MSREALLQSAQENFKLARSDSNATLTEEQIKLLRYQKSMEDVLQESIVGKPLHDTVKVLLMRNELKLADKLRSEYKISDRRYNLQIYFSSILFKYIFFQIVINK